MKDRELLEFAAKAVGIELICNDHGEFGYYDMFRDHLPQWNEWNPLTDDGDALRLAVKLDMIITSKSKHGTSAVLHDDLGGKWLIDNKEQHNGDPYAATRRAIVRAAAAIGAEI